MKELNLFTMLDPRKERMPANFSMPKAKFKYIPMVNPNAMVKFHSGIQRNLAPYKSIDKSAIRANVKERLSRAVDTVNTYVTQGVRIKGVSFQVHQESGRSYMVLKDQKTGEVLKTYPGELALNIAGRLKMISDLGKKVEL